MVRTTFYSIALLLSLSSAVAAQPLYIVNITGGYSLPLADLKGTYPDSLGMITNDVLKTYLMSNGYNIGINGKYAIDSSRKARIIGGFSYNAFSRTKDYTSSTGNRTIKNKINILSLTAGLEYSTNPYQRINLYAGLEFMVNFFSGKIETLGDSIRIQNRKKETRFGVQVSGGIDIKINNSIGAIAGVKYSIANLIGRTRQPEVSNSQSTDTEEQGSNSKNEIPLNDGESGTIRAKDIYFLQFYAGLSLYFGQAKKRVK